MARSDGVCGPFSVGYVVHDLALSPTSGGGDYLLASSSFINGAANFVDIAAIDPSSPQPLLGSRARLSHYFPPTRLRWLSPDLLATSGDYLRIWSASGDLRVLLRHDENPRNLCTPITSVDTRNRQGSSQLVSCDVYGICALWDVERGVKQQSLDLGQRLCDVAFGPDGLVAIAGDRGDCFLMDPRQPQDVSVFTLRERVHGPARIAWGSSDRFAIAWQGEEGGVALYDVARHGHKHTPHLLRLTAPVTVDLQWSPAFPQMLCCAKDDGVVDVWQFPEVSTPASNVSGPCFSWAPTGASAETCTALALSPEILQGQHFIALATVSANHGPQSQSEATSCIWIAGLPKPSQPMEQHGDRGTSDVTGHATILAASSPAPEAVVVPLASMAAPSASPVGRRCDGSLTGDGRGLGFGRGLDRSSSILIQ